MPLVPPAQGGDDCDRTSESSGSWSCDEVDSSEWDSDDTVSAKYFSPKAAGPTPSLSATVSVTPYSEGITLPSPHGGTPLSVSAQPSAVKARGDRSSDQGSQTRERTGSSCGFPPGSKGCAGGAGSGRGSDANEGGGNGGSVACPTSRSTARRTSERWNHFPVVAFHDAYTETEHGCVCMVMEYMDGGTLQQFVSRGQALSESSLAAVAHSVLRGLAEMHAKHQIHRDIKPSNILVDRHGRVKISDFGIVRELTGASSLATTFTGTLTYMSPERITERDYSYPSDLWSLGLVSPGARPWKSSRPRLALRPPRETPPGLSRLLL